MHAGRLVRCKLRRTLMVESSSTYESLEAGRLLRASAGRKAYTFLIGTVESSWRGATVRLRTGVFIRAVDKMATVVAGCAARWSTRPEFPSARSH